MEQDAHFDVPLVRGLGNGGGRWQRLLAVGDDALGVQVCPGRAVAFHCSGVVEHRGHAVPWPYSGAKAFVEGADQLGRGGVVAVLAVLAGLAVDGCRQARGEGVVCVRSSGPFMESGLGLRAPIGWYYSRVWFALRSHARGDPVGGEGVG